MKDKLEPRKLAGITKAVGNKGNDWRNPGTDGKNATATNAMVAPVRDFFNEVFLISQLTLELLHELGSRALWVWMAIKFFLYVVLLSVPLWRAMFVFFISDYIKRGIRYGPNGRNLLDIYFASPSSAKYHEPKYRKGEKKYPVAIFLTGGAWIIGYKAWGAFMGMLLAQLGVIFVSPDYRNFPQVKIQTQI